MKNFSFILCFIPLIWACNSNRENTQLQSQHLHLLSQNETLFLPSHTFFHDSSNHKSGSGTEKNVISSHLVSLLPPFVINKGTAQCVQHSQLFLQGIHQMEMWALKMYDSSGKIPSGLLNGNVNQFGDFDQCLNVDEFNLNIKGKYCLAFLQIHPTVKNFEKKDNIFQAFKLMQSHFSFKSKFTDSGHRVPRFSTMHWGLCVPSSCSSEDVENHLKSILENYTNNTEFTIEVKVEKKMCQVAKPFKVSLSFFIVSSLFLSVVLISIAATVKDIFSSEKNSILNCFSLKRNVKSLFSLTRSADDIQCVHGIRMINALMLVLAHKSMALFFIPYANRTAMVERMSQPWCIIARIASLYTDSFIMISGLLTSYSFIKSLKKKGALDLKNEYISRLIRIVPPLAAIILLSTFIIPELGSGPQWNLTVAQHADQCRQTWWKNFLFIHNYLGFENMCLTHTHHLGIDTQLFFISPFMVYMLYKWPLYGISLLIGLATTSTVARYKVTADKNLSFFVFPGISVSQMFDTANYSYIIPFHRLTIYIIGIFLGYALRYYGNGCKMKKNFIRIGWTVTFSFLSYVLSMANEMNHHGYNYNNKEAALYAALAPIAWSLFFAWIIFLSQMGYGGFIGRIASSKYCLIWTRLSYAVYLTQFPIFFFNVGLQKYSQQYSIFLLASVLEYVCVLIASVALTLFFDMPFGNLKKLFIKR